MTENARKLRSKANELLKLYSLWHETHRDEFERRCIRLLGEILLMEPGFSLRRQFQRAF